MTRKRHAVIRDHRADSESAEHTALILNASTATMVVALKVIGSNPARVVYGS
jgi:hypothetical protein